MYTVATGAGLAGFVGGVLIAVGVVHGGALLIIVTFVSTPVLLWMIRLS